MIIGKGFLFLLVPKSASSSIRYALRDHGVMTSDFHDYLKDGQVPPETIVAAVKRPWDEVLKSAWRYRRSVGDCEKWCSGEQREPRLEIVQGRDIRSMNHSFWFRHVTHTIEWHRLHEDWAEFLDAAGLPQIALDHLNKSKVKQ